MSKRQVRVRINGMEYHGEVEPRKLLTDFIRDDLGLTGTHVGCEHGVCGACTILLNGDPARSCLMLSVQANDAGLKTVEGLAPSADVLHPLQEKFWESHGLQCGFCTPGMLLTAEALLKEIQQTPIVTTKARYVGTGSWRRRHHRRSDGERRIQRAGSGSETAAAQAWLHPGAHGPG